uniref:CD81 molecule n=1 Tax=Apteryx owenii TaxID=8824 RepID=A0A8B9NZY4_APTOW
MHLLFGIDAAAPRVLLPSSDCLQEIQDFLKKHMDFVFVLLTITICFVVYGMILTSFLCFSIHFSNNLDRKGKYTLRESFPCFQIPWSSYAKKSIFNEPMTEQHLAGRGVEPGSPRGRRSPWDGRRRCQHARVWGAHRVRARWPGFPAAAMGRGGCRNNTFSKPACYNFPLEIQPEVDAPCRKLQPAQLKLAGGIILGVALWLRHDSQTTNILYLQLGDKQAPNTFYVGIYILIAVGAVMMFVGFLGCYGAIQESQCLLGTFFTCLVILFACEVAAGIWGFVNKDQIAKDVKQFYDQAFQQALMAESETNNGKAVVKTFHETLDCCGPGAGAAVITALWKEELCPKKDSFMQSVPQLTSSCHQKIDELFSGKLYLIGIAAIVVAVIMIFEMILSMVLCCGIRNSSVY